ncbi:MAG: beta strand repeat-containing protein [Janthinobacterium lividum]
MTTLTVGSGQQYGTISAAVAAATSGDTINVQAGTYTNDFPGAINGLTIQGVGGIVKLVATTQPPNGKAILDVAGNTTLRNLDISGVTVPDANGAGIRYEGGNLVIQNTAIHGNQDGILGAADPAGTITIDGSEIYSNGTGTGSTHNIYIGDIATFTLTNSYIHDANVGHEVKSRAETNIITNNRIEDGSSSASYQIDLPNGGNATISGNVIQKSANSGNHVTIAYGEEGNAHSGTAVSITGNTFVSDQSGAAVIWNSTGATVSASNNSTYNYSQIDKAGRVSANGFNAIGSRPTLDTSSPIQSGGGSTSSPTPTPVADTTAPTLTVTESNSGVTNSPTDTVSGTVTDSGSGVAKVEIYDTIGGRTVDLGAATLANGSYSFATGKLADGTHAFTAVAIDKSGNATAVTSAGATLTVDTVAPALTASQSTSGTTTNTGNVISGTATDSGTGVSRVEIYDTIGGRTVDLGAATLNGSAWSFAANKLATGSHAFSAIATDAAGNASTAVSAGAAETIVAATPVTPTNPTPPVSTTPPVVTAPVVPTIGSASLTNAGTLQFNGTAQANSVVTLTDTNAGGTRTVGSVTAGNDGTWHITPATINQQTMNQFAVSATSGNTATAGSASLTLSSTNSELLTGTAGKADVFTFAANASRDYISGFETNRDVIDLVGSSYHSFEQIQAKFTGSGSTIFSTGATSAIAIVGVDPSALTAANFRFT